MKWLTPLLLFALVAPASAETNMADSIEWQVADSQVVVRGVVTAVAGSDATLQIAETLKGDVKGTLHVSIPNAGKKELEHWRTAKTDLLVFLVGGKLRASHFNSENPFVLGTSKAYTADFQVLTKDSDVLAAVRTAAHSTATKSHRVDVPWDTPAMKALYSGSVVWMNVPVDAALEQLAIRWLADPATRKEGALALANFRSPANIERMQNLLADPDFSVVTATGKPKMKRYQVRVAADAALTAWHVPHTTPTLEEPAPK
jgi:hypothetical protein